MLMAHPNAEDGLVPEITEEYKRDYHLYRKNAELSTQLNAKLSLECRNNMNEIVNLEYKSLSSNDIIDDTSIILCQQNKKLKVDHSINKESISIQEKHINTTKSEETNIINPTISNINEDINVNKSNNITISTIEQVVIDDDLSNDDNDINIFNINGFHIIGCNHYSNLN